MRNREYTKALKHYSMALTVPEVSEILRVSTKLVYRMLKEGKIPYVQIGREKRIPKTELILFMTNKDRKHSNPQNDNSLQTIEKKLDF